MKKKVIWAVLGCLMASGIHAADPIGTRYVYKTIHERELSLYVTKPADWNAGDSRPAVVFFHGGGWNGGDPGE